MIIKGPGELGIWRTSGVHPKDSSIENDQNTEKSPEDLKRLAVTQTPVNDADVKNSKGVNNNNDNNNNNTCGDLMSLKHQWKTIS